MKKTAIGIITIILLVVVIVSINNKNTETIKIGVITPLTEGSAYWGESTLVGIKLAKKELEERGVEVEFVVEDGQLDPVVALNAAQKLVNVDSVDAIYSEFNPASVAVSSFLKDTDIFHLYDSAAESPLDNGDNNFKTYLDYKQSCKEVSQYIKDNKNISSVGVLKMNIEHGELCLEGINEVFRNNVVVEEYNYGETDFRTLIQKISQNNVDAIFHTSFQPETIASLRNLNEIGNNKLFVGLSETITDEYRDEIGELIEGDVFFGLPIINSDLREKIKEANNRKDVADYNASALAYVHLVQLAEALSGCNDVSCVGETMASSKAVSEIGFEGFENRIAKFDTRIVEYRDREFVEAYLGE